MEDVAVWEEFSEPYFWSATGLTVIKDRHGPDGVREHVVKEPGYDGKLILGARVFSDKSR